jgi:hypothetical protein
MHRDHDGFWADQKTTGKRPTSKPFGLPNYDEFRTEQKPAETVCPESVCPSRTMTDSGHAYFALASCA